ncbi:hypothetical protein, partial [Paraburkholderia sp. EG304]|uniref:hypothetical protein n=1 Tax=Paraburkholderia sp. EG304 TaxID=3237015 RepID=UPI003979F244
MSTTAERISCSCFLKYRHQVSRIGVIEPGMIGVMRPPGMAPKRDFEGTQECVVLPDFATAFS